MENTTTKISFGFKKIVEKPNLLKNNVESIKEPKKIELIGSIEGSTLNVIGKDPKDDIVQKLIIPMTNDQKTRPIAKLIESRKIKKEEADSLKKENGDIPKENDETLEQRAAREIMEDLKNTSIKTETKVLELPIHPDELPLNGATESTLDDYENIPISDFGKAMLRGMGWKEEDKKKEDLIQLDMPIVRPKGLGLGADKVIKKQKLLVAPSINEVLEIKRNACVKILAGKHKNFYGTIEGFDDGGGRLIVKLAIGGLKVLMNEFMIQPVPKQEYAKYSKILNSEKYEEFKKDEKKTSSNVEKIVKIERRSRSLSPSTSRGRDNSKASRSRDSHNASRDDNSSRGRDDNRRNKSCERNRSKERRRSRERTSSHYKKDVRRHSSDSEDDKTYNRKYNERRRSRSHDKHRKRYSSSDSSSERYKSKKKSGKKSSKSKSKKQSSPERFYSSDDEKKHKRKYKRSKHHRDRS